MSDSLVGRSLTTHGLREIWIGVLREPHKKIKLSSPVDLRLIDEVPFADYVDTNNEELNKLFIGGLNAAENKEIINEKNIHAVLSLG